MHGIKALGRRLRLRTPHLSRATRVSGQVGAKNLPKVAQGPGAAVPAGGGASRDQDPPSLRVPHPNSRC